MQEDDLIELAVNGSLMRDLEMNDRLVGVGASFVRDAVTAPIYRLWTVDDVYPAMVRTRHGDGGPIAVEVWRVPLWGVTRTLVGEPTGLTIGRVTLGDGSSVLGVLAEPALVEGRTEITSHGGWRAYLASLEQGEQR